MTVWLPPETEVAFLNFGALDVGDDTKIDFGASEFGTREVDTLERSVPTV
jgi:hypothetical protein